VRRNTAGRNSRVGPRLSASLAISLVIGLAALAAVGTASAAPTARCTVSDATVAPGEAVTIDASSSSGGIVAVRYDRVGDSTFGDAVDATERTVEYGETGSYRPRVAVVGETGTDYASCGEVTVSEFAVDLLVEPSEPSPGEPVTFATSTSGTSESPLVYRWDFDGDGEIDAETEESQTTTEYGSEGAKRATVTVMDGADRRASETTTVAVGSPVARCRLGTAVVQPGAEVRLDARDSVGAIGYRFDRTGDGTVDVERDTGTATFAYAEAGSYGPTVEVTDSDGVTDTADCGELAVRDVAVSLMASQSTVPPGESVTFTADFDSPAAGGAVYRWDLDGDGSIEVETTEASYTTAFDSEGDRTVRVTAVDGDGVAESASTDVSVSVNSPPEASFEVSPSSPAVGEDVTFSASASDPDGNVVAYEWAVDGTQVGTGPQTTWQPPSADTYTVVLAVTDGEGATTSVDRSVTVGGANSPPNVSVAVQPASPRANDTVQLAANASDPDGQVVDYRWTVDGSVVGSGPQTSWTPPQAGSYTVAVTVTDDDSASTSASRTVSVAPAQAGPSAAWWISPENATVDVPTTFVVAEPNSNATYEWDVGDNGSVERTGHTVEVQFDSPGTRVVRLRARAAGAANSTRKEVSVGPSTGTPVAGPNLSIYHYPERPAVGENLTLSPAGFGGPDSNITYAWDLNGDGTYAESGFAQRATFSTTGDHTIRLRAQFPGGATKTASVTIRVVRDTPTTAGATTTPGGAGFGPLVALAGLLGGLAARRYHA
jgi:hypothetical protein